MARHYDKIKLNRKQDRRARFTDDDVCRMRELYQKGYTQSVIAGLFGASRSTVSYIVSDGARQRLAEYKRLHPPKRRTAEEARVYMRDLRKYKRSLMKGSE